MEKDVLILLYDFYFSETMLLMQEFDRTIYDLELQQGMPRVSNSVYLEGKLVRYTLMCSHGNDHGCKHEDLIFLGTASMDDIRINDSTAMFPIELSEKYSVMKKLFDEFELKLH